MSERYRLSWHERRAIEVPRPKFIRWLLGPKYISPWLYHTLFITGITIDREKINITPAIVDPLVVADTSLTYEPTSLPYCEGEGSFIDNPSFEEVDDIWTGWSKASDGED